VRLTFIDSIARHLIPYAGHQFSIDQENSAELYQQTLMLMLELMNRLPSTNEMASALLVRACARGCLFNTDYLATTFRKRPMIDRTLAQIQATCMMVEESRMAAKQALVEMIQLALHNIYSSNQFESIVQASEYFANIARWILRAIHISSASNTTSNRSADAIKFYVDWIIRFLDVLILRVGDCNPTDEMRLVLRHLLAGVVLLQQHSLSQVDTTTWQHCEAYLESHGVLYSTDHVSLLAGWSTDLYATTLVADMIVELPDTCQDQQQQVS
jgi:hypothetical protein